ncbi:hypothetical protein LTR10_023371 [Elasticomyces elasticus]|uniref:Carboxylesterase type B domain-containing protein n=1 Tax=Exophiala sideris TaxID=1016849 RepID=A0ABR0IUY4_9EURO|nr:hypothetical protein LTR10_023371 [Elasticomyces elasticus]KAK5023146.1 hypothetical protein LTR13_011290 [Exophiala sideris]KAK5023368.1 hypothetical protein LTS07_009243 [Exophiala sideris]KAK5048730.1 hypothetical protein LTR69_011321 [Exophiala sideris]KAK5176132.1 hypothetical protein LTR44_011311 [Eurotiomycetes sp. CCFEE 6388]
MEKLHSICGSKDLQTILVEDLLAGIGKLGFKNWWINEEAGVFARGPEGAVWPFADLPELETILVGDCHWESRGFEPGIAALGLPRLRDIFAQHTPVGAEIVKLYGIDFTLLDTTKSRIGAFINDLKFAFASDEIVRMETDASKRTCFRYIVDQENPWRPAAGAHHAIDLLFLFGEYDYSHVKEAVAVSDDMRKKWVAYMYGVAPWDPNSVYAFGPSGKTGVIDTDELAQRRRVHCIDGLRRIGWSSCQPLATRLMSARGNVKEAYEE